MWDFTSSSSFVEFPFGLTDAFGPVIAIGWMKVEGLVLSGVPADANIDGKVDVNDLALLAANWHTAGDFVHGDFDFNGFVDENDLGILAMNWPGGGGGLSFADAAESFGLPRLIPEPTSLALIPLATLLIARRRR
jgi:hypothetical protein